MRIYPHKEVKGARIKMKNLITDTQEKAKDRLLTNLSAIALHFTLAVLGFVASRGVILDNLMPFGIVFVGGCSLVFLPSIAIGSFLGYFIPAVSTGGFKYIASLLAIVALRLILSGFYSTRENPYFLGLIAIVSNAITGAVTYSGVPLDILKLAAESIIIFCAVLITNTTFVTLSKNAETVSKFINT